MKTITIDLKSFCFGALTLGAVLLMANKPASQPTTQPVVQPQPYPTFGRYQAVAAGTGGQIVVIDTQTGKFLVEQTSIGRPRWIPGDFEQMQQQGK